MSWNNRVDPLTSGLIHAGINWEVLDWERFRQEYYEDYFVERDSAKDKTSLLLFRETKLSRMKKYNLKYKMG